MHGWNLEVLIPFFPTLERDVDLLGDFQIDN